MPRGYSKDALIIFLLLAFIFAYFFQDPGWNENSRFDLVFAAVEQNTFTIDKYYNKADTLTDDRSLVNGHYYSDKAIGPAIFGAALYEPINWINSQTLHLSRVDIKELLTILLVGLPSAFEGVLIYLLCLYLSRKRVRSFLITLAITLGTMYFPYSGAFFSHQITSALIFTAFFLAFFIREGKILPKGFTIFLMGLLMGWAFISEFPCALILLSVGIYALIVLWKNPSPPRWFSILLLGLGALIPVILQLVYDKICFGSPFSMGYQNLDNNYFKTSMGKGLMGIGLPNFHVAYYMTFHPMLGLFWQSPVLILAFVGIVFGLLQKKYRGEVLMAVWIVFSYVVMISGYYQWWGGYALSARHIIPILPFFCLLLVFLPDPFNWPLAGLGLVSAGQMFLSAATTIEVPDTYISQLAKMKFFKYSYIYDFCIKQFTQAKFDTNLGRIVFHLRSFESLIPFFVVFLIMVLVFFWKEIWQGRKIELHHPHLPLSGSNKLKDLAL